MKTIALLIVLLSTPTQDVEQYPGIMETDYPEMIEACVATQKTDREFFHKIGCDDEQTYRFVMQYQLHN